MRAVRAELDAAQHQSQEVVKKNQQLEHEAASSQRSLSSELERLRAEIRGRDQERSHIEMNLQRCQRDIQGAQQRLQVVENEKVNLEKQLEQQRHVTHKHHEDLEEELRKCREMQLQTAHCAEQERLEKVRALQEARMYRSLLDDSNSQMQGFNGERQDWLEERNQLLEARQVLQQQLVDLLSGDDDSYHEAKVQNAQLEQWAQRSAQLRELQVDNENLHERLSEEEANQDQQFAQLRELQLENQHLHNQHIQDQASQAELLKELLRTQKQLEGANADLSSLEVNIETQDRAPVSNDQGIVASHQDTARVPPESHSHDERKWGCY